MPGNSRLPSPSVIALLLVGAACAPPQAPDTRAADALAIRSADSAWSARSLAHDLDGTVSYYSADASLLVPNAPIANTKEQIRAAWAPLVAPNATVSWKATNVDVARSGDMGYVTGTYDLSIKDSKGEAATDHGKFVEVWKKQADGTWKCVADIFNSDLPAMAPAPPKKK